jgi:putative intracellular protease/amidase
VVDDRLVTGQNPASAAGVAKEMEKLFAEVIHQEKAEEQHATEALRAEKDAEKAAAAGDEDER